MPDAEEVNTRPLRLLTLPGKLHLLLAVACIMACSSKLHVTLPCSTSP